MDCVDLNRFVIINFTHYDVKDHKTPKVKAVCKALARVGSVARVAGTFCES